MKAAEVMRVLGISRGTLGNYLKSGKITGRRMPNGQWDYDEDVVLSLLNKGVKRRTYLYARVTDDTQMDDLVNQIGLLTQFCAAKNYKISGVFRDIGSEFDSWNRTGFMQMMHDVVAGKVERIVVMSKDRLFRFHFEMLEYFLQKYRCEIVTMFTPNSKIRDSREFVGDMQTVCKHYELDSAFDGRISPILERVFL